MYTKRINKKFHADLEKLFRFSSSCIFMESNLPQTSAWIEIGTSCGKMVLLIFLIIWIQGSTKKLIQINHQYCTHNHSMGDKWGNKVFHELLITWDSKIKGIRIFSFNLSWFRLPNILRVKNSPRAPLGSLANFLRSVSTSTFLSWSN